jgi:IS1 family transposase
MNTLSVARRAAIVRALVDGASIRSIARMMRCDKDTVTRVLVEVGGFCSMYQDFVLTNLTSVTRVEADEIWSYVGAKQKNATKDGQGDIWTWTAICADSKLAITWLVGDRSPASAHAFIRDLSERVVNRIQLTTDQYGAYIAAVHAAFDYTSKGIDYAQIRKKFAFEGHGQGGRYSPSSELIEVEKVPLIGNPKLSLISTSYVERQNLTMRMNMRRFTRLTNGFSKKAENHAHAVSLHFMAYNFCKPHGTLTKKAKGTKTTPAMAAGLTDHVWTFEEVLGLMDPARLIHARPTVCNN